MLHDRAEDRGLEVLPLVFALGDGDEVVAEEHADHARYGEEALRQGRALAAAGLARIERARLHDHAAWKKLQGGGVGRGFGLDEHGGGSHRAVRRVYGSAERRAENRSARRNRSRTVESRCGVARAPIKSAAAQTLAVQPANASMSSSVRLPGTITTGTGNVLAATPAKFVTSGPGPSLEVPAARIM